MLEKAPISRSRNLRVVACSLGNTFFNFSRCNLYLAISPLQFSFTGTLRILRRAISQFQQALPSSLPYFYSWLISEIAEQIIPTRQGRTNPRVVKKPRSKFRARKPIHRTGFTQLQPLTFAVASFAT